jgi:hypothetical protein
MRHVFVAASVSGRLVPLPGSGISWRSTLSSDQRRPSNDEPEILRAIRTAPQACALPLFVCPSCVSHGARGRRVQSVAIATMLELLTEWNAQRLRPSLIPARSDLYSLEPIGVRTAWTESFTSYIARLAYEHCVFPGALMDHLIQPLTSAGRDPHKDAPRVYESRRYASHLLHANGARAQAALARLEALTMRSDLRTLTLIPWADVFSISTSLRSTKAWCPTCYEEWAHEGRVIYDPLLWAFKEVTFCQRHHRPLCETCPYPDCARSLPSLGSKMRPGYCSDCQRWLGSSNLPEAPAQSPAAQDEDRWQVWVSEMLGELLARAATRSCLPTTQELSERLSEVIDRATGGDIAAFAWLTRCAQPEILLWVKQETRPHLGMLLRVCFTLHLALFDLLAPSPRELCPVIPEHERPRKVSRRSLYGASQRMALQLALDDLLARGECPPASLVQVARRLGYCTRVLRSCNAAACRAISLRFQAYRHQRVEERYR